jgi:hypothetical protein
MGIIRAAFWLSALVMLLPADKESGTQAPGVGVFDTIVAAKTTVGDFSQFCVRNPDVCVTGSGVLAVFGDKARTGVKLVSHLFGHSGAAPGPATGTLTRDDLQPAWHKPQPVKAAAGA